MADIQTVIGTIVGGKDNVVNARYQDIVNYEPIKMSFHNDSYKKKFKQSYGERSDSLYFSWIKRLGTDRIKLYNWDLAETGYDEEWFQSRYDITDAVFLDGARYLFAVSKDKTRMKIFKQCFVNQTNTCFNDSTEEVTEWVFLNITKYDYFDPNTNTIETRNYFPFSACLYDKFVVTDWAKGKIKDEWMTGVARNELIWENVQTFFYDSSNSPINASPGDFLLIYGGSLSSQVNKVSGIGYATWTILDALLMENVFAWLSNVSVSGTTTTITDGNTSISALITYPTSEDSSNQKYRVFSEYGDVLLFATSDWLFTLNYSEDKPSQSVFTSEGNTFYNTINNNLLAPFVISWLVDFTWQIIFFNSKNWTLYAGLSGIQKMYFDPRNTQTFGRDFTDIDELSGYLLMTWPEKMALMQPTFIGSGGVTFAQFQYLKKNTGYFNKWSWDIEDWVLHMVTSKNNYMKLALKIFTGWFQPEIVYEQCSYQSDLDMLVRGRNFVYLNVQDWDVKMFINNGTHSKVLLYDSYYSVWYKWMYFSIIMRWYKANAWLGNGLFNRVWYKDKDPEFDIFMDYPTLLKYVFDENPWVLYMFNYIKFYLGYNSYITKDNTVIRMSTNIDWRYQETVYDSLWRTDYVHNIMKLYKTGNVDTVFKNYPIGIELSGGNGLWYINTDERFFDKEFIAWVQNESLTVPENDTNPKTVFNISKFSNIEIPMGIAWNTLAVEFITKWGDRLEIGWVSPWFQSYNQSQTRMENVLTQSDFFGADKGKALTDDSGIDRKFLW